jgi:N,N'-diacetylchitobiose transport system permease protein
MLIFLSVIWDFKVFTQIYAMSLNAPDNTMTLSVYAYVIGISDQQYGYAAAASVVMMLLLLFALVPYIRRMISSLEDQ